MQEPTHICWSEWPVKHVLFNKTRLCSLIAYISDSQWSRGWQLPIHYCPFLSSMMTWWHSTFIGIGKMAENCWSSINPAEAETIQHWVVHFPSWNPNKLLFRTSVDSNWSSTTPIEWFFFSTLHPFRTSYIGYTYNRIVSKQTQNLHRRQLQLKSNQLAAI